MKSILTLFLALLFASCESPTPSSPESVKPIDAPPALSQPAKIKLSWEDPKNPEREKWTDHLVKVVEENFETLDQAKDASRFCSSYAGMEKREKVRMWGEMFVATSFYESSWKPTTRMKETTMGKDCITGSQIWSEGLLQLSYCDKTWAKKCAFDWTKDKALASDDPKKTILNPEINLTCGGQIMAMQVKRTGKVILSSGVYWAVLKEGGKYTQVQNILNRVKKAMSCK